MYDAENCQACYAGMPGLTPYEARDERLWVYLTHTLHLNYVRARWPIPADDMLAISHIRTHFFAESTGKLSATTGVLGFGGWLTCASE
jgi:hypothetical protein